MYERPGVSLQTILHSLETRVPKIIIQRVEELYPAVMQSMVSCLCAENNCILLFSGYLYGYKTKFCVKFVLISHLVCCYRFDAVGNVYSESVL